MCIFVSYGSFPCCIVFKQEVDHANKAHEAAASFSGEVEEEDLTSSANQLGCTDVPVTWSKTSVLSVYHVKTV